MAKYNFKGQEIDISVDEIHPYRNDQYCGVKLYWSGAIGFGEFGISVDLQDESRWTGDSECMCDNEHKEFLAALFADILEKIDIKG